eukprot:TRINITY_DN6291_c0_g3_i1.p1 TRINITY_DN6291_c0_g3~~TRINITY_DN6291_c0_g3_i1.p1  ORF type:complete len:204 (+),score=62.42 TRINITY_DN6291_c0_g3_i1:197-808(+)
MKPAWDKLADAHSASGTVLIADVDCTSAGGKSVCAEQGVRGYPTIKYFSEETGMSGEAYSGGRSFEDLDSFVKEHLAKFCDPQTKEYCDDQEKTYVDKQKGKDIAELSAELERLRALAAGAVKDDGKSKAWILKRIKILEALVGPSLLQRVKKMWSKFYFRVNSQLSRWAMSLVDVLEPRLQGLAQTISQWYQSAKKTFSSEL